MSLLNIAIEASLKAGEAILEVYNSDFAIEIKEDRSPLTLADKKSNEIITSFLIKTGIPILSEEGKDIPYNERKNWKKFWLVDPLDGTKEFIKKNGEFTVNIALIEDRFPVLGVIYIPVKKILYFAENGVGAFKLEEAAAVGSGSWQQQLTGAEKLPLLNNKTKFTAIASRSHLSPETEEYINQLKKEHGEIELISAGSSLKFCLVAEGKANVYPRFAPTMEWDTAAGQAISEQAGFSVVNKFTNQLLEYNKENLRNSFFLVKKK